MRAQQAAAAPFNEVQRQSDDARSALIFFDFNCPVCATHHEKLVSWGSALPREWRAEFIPVALPTKESVVAARAFFAVAAADPAKLTAFMAAAYRRVHGAGAPMSAQSTWTAAVREAGVRGFEAAWAKVSTKQLEAAMAKLLTYGINSTPSIAIGGRFVITPDNTNGEANLFYQLANGMVSRAMSQG